MHRAGDLIVVADEPGAADFASMFEASALRVGVERDFTTAAWGKLLSNLAGNPLTALTERRMEVFADRGIRRLEVDTLTGALLRAADRHGLPAPLNEAVFTLLSALDGALKPEGRAGTRRSPT